MKYLKTAMAAGVLFALAGCDQKVAEPVEPSNAEVVAPVVNDGVVLDSHQKRVSYLAAVKLASEFKAAGVPLDANAIAAAVRDVMSGADSRLSPEEIQETATRFQTEQLQRQQELLREQEEQTALAEAEFARVSEENAVAGEAFLKENAVKEGVVTTDSGLQYKVLVAGNGPVPQLNDQVEVHYRGTLLDGTEFDSSLSSGEPAVFAPTDVIPGWTEALQMMPVGSKWELYVPSDLAYGSGGVGTIGPNATLVFEIELLNVKAQQ